PCASAFVNKEKSEPHERIHREAKLIGLREPAYAFARIRDEARLVAVENPGAERLLGRAQTSLRGVACVILGHVSVSFDARACRKQIGVVPSLLFLLPHPPATRRRLRRRP